MGTKSISLETLARCQGGLHNLRPVCLLLLLLLPNVPGTPSNAPTKVPTKAPTSSMVVTATVSVAVQSTLTTIQKQSLEYQFKRQLESSFASSAPVWTVSTIDPSRRAISYCMTGTSTPTDQSGFVSAVASTSTQSSFSSSLQSKLTTAGIVDSSVSALVAGDSASNSNSICTSLNVRVGSYPCSDSTRPLQIINNQYLSSLDPSNGHYTTHWTLSQSVSSPQYTNLNAADISSKDSKVYGVFMLEGVATRYFARFDQTAIEFVARSPLHNCNLNAGAFDHHGDFYSSCGGTYYRVARPDLLQGYTAHSSVTVDMSPFLTAPVYDVADVASLYYDLEKTGTNQDWLVGIATLPVNKVILIRTDVKASYVLTASGWVNGGGFGAAWTFQDSRGVQHVYFAANNGGGVWELLVNTVDLSKTNSDATGVSLQRLGASAAATTNHDGISCHTVLTLVPFPTCGDKNGAGFGPDPNPVTDAECPSGYVYDPAMADRACSVNPCQVKKQFGDGFGADFSCCWDGITSAAAAGFLTPSPTASAGSSDSGGNDWWIYALVVVLVLLLCCLCCCLFCCWWRRRKQNWHEFDDVEMPEKKALKQRANPEAIDILQQRASKSRAYDDPVAPLPAVHSSFGDEGADAEASSGEFTVEMMQMHQPPPVMAEVSREREVEYSELSFTVATNDEEVPYVPALLEGVLLQRVADRMDIDINAVKMGATRVSLVRKDVGTAKVLVDKEVYDNVSNEITKDDNLDCLPPGCSEMWTVRLAKKPNRSPEVLTFNVSTGQDGMAVDKDTFLDRFLPRLAQELQVPVDGLSVAGVKGSLLRRDLVQVKVQVDGRWVVRGVRSTVDRAEFLAATQVFDDLLPGYTVTFSSGKAKQAKQAKQLVSQLRSSME